MNQNQYKPSDMTALEKLDEIIESAELELQRAITLYELQTEAGEAFKDVIEYMRQMQDIALSIEEEHAHFIAVQKISLYSSHFQEVAKQVHIKL